MFSVIVVVVICFDYDIDIVLWEETCCCFLNPRKTATVEIARSLCFLRVPVPLSGGTVAAGANGAVRFVLDLNSNPKLLNPGIGEKIALHNRP